jgi:hypothetical protein
MQEDQSPRPKIRHSTAGKDVRKLKRLLHAFVKEAENKTARNLHRGVKLVNLQDASEENLLAQRKELVSLVKAGMLKREDKEIEIAVQAAIVWFLRLEEAKQRRILELF